MARIIRLSDSCLILESDAHRTLVDPGFHPFRSGAVDLETVGDVDRVLVTHEHRDHVEPEFVAWLRDRRRDLVVHTNRAVAELLAGHGIEAHTDDPDGVTSEDLSHEPIPTGDAPPNRSFTIEGILTHPGDSQQATTTAPVLALPLLAPWTSTTAAVAFARRLGPRAVVPVHDFYLDASGRAFIRGLAARALGPDIEVLDLDWGGAATV